MYMYVCICILNVLNNYKFKINFARNKVRLSNKNINKT